MSKNKFVLAFMTAFFLLPFGPIARAADPLVTPDWLQNNLVNPKAVILDIRKGKDYSKGHIPHAINFFYNYWAIEKEGRRNEIPNDGDLRESVGSLGLVKDATVIVVGNAGTPQDRFSVTRVAWTLKYAGVRNVSVLNGGYDRWRAEKRRISTTPKRGKGTVHDAPFNRDIYADKAHVMARIGKATIVDTREESTFTGEKKLDFVAKIGHIRGAVNLPSFQMFTEKGAFKSPEELAAMAIPVVGSDKDKEIIVYCDSGRVASGWWFILTEALGYKNVKLYDGSAQDWTADPAGPMEP